VVHGRKEDRGRVRGKGGEAGLERGNGAGGWVGIQDYLPPVGPSLLGHRILFIPHHHDKRVGSSLLEGRKDPGQEGFPPRVE